MKKFLDNFTWPQILVLVILIVIAVFLLLDCKSAEKNLTAKNLQCHQLTNDNALSCCAQFFTGKESSSSKDVTCAKIVDVVADSLREKQKQDNYKFCEGGEKNVKRDFGQCWDKLNSK